MYFFYLKFSKSHTSQTRRRAGNPAVRFTTICLSNMPLNFLSSFEACLPYKITHLSNLHHIFVLKIEACLPYKITHLSNHDKEVLIMARGLFTIQNYTPLKLIYHLLNCKNCLTIIKNYTPLKLLSMRYPCVVV